MSKTTAKLILYGDEFEEKERELHSVSYSFTRATDKEGQTTGIARGGLITMKVKALNSGNSDLLNWMCTDDLAIKGKIEFMDPSDTAKKMKEIEFTEAYCVDFKEYWGDETDDGKVSIVRDGDSEIAHWELITISCKEIICGNRVNFNARPEPVEEPEVTKFQAFPAMLFVGDDKTGRQVSSLSYSFSQATDKEGQTTGVPRGGKITLTLKALNEENADMANWMLDKSTGKNGSIVFRKTNKIGEKLKELVFEGGHCIDFVETWDDPDSAKDKSLAHVEKITISCKRIKLKGITFSNEWR